MPKKLNFLGGQQNYNPNNGQYEPALVGANGESPSQFSSFKKQKSEFEKNNDKRLGKFKKEEKESPKESEVFVSDAEISEALGDYEWAITDKTTVKSYAEEIAKKTGASPKQVAKVIKSQAPNEITDDTKMSEVLDKWYNESDENQTEEDNYVHSEWHNEIKVKKSVYDAFAEQVGWNEDTMKIKDFVEKGNYSKEDLEQLGDYLEEYNYHKSAKVVRNWADTQGNKKNTGIAKSGEWKLTPEIAKNIKENYKTQADAESAVHDVFGGGWDDGSEEGNKKLKDYNAIMKSIADMYGEKPYEEYKTTAKPTVGQEPKEKSLNDYTDELFEKAKVKTFTSQKYKNPQGEIVEIRRFGEGQNAIRYNETTKKVEQVWINGERVK